MSLFAALVGMDKKRDAQITTGRYMGDGGFGESSPTTLSFPFEPKIVYIFQESYYPYAEHNIDSYNTDPGSVFSATNVVFYYGASQFCVGVEEVENVLYEERICYTMDGCMLRWYYESDNTSSNKTDSQKAAKQLNYANGRYYYIAIGT